ncbi:hypothetical protein M5E87_17100 [Flavonifractor plautii]|nr:hypothetical protein M5E87_17100 [Flavonifractor plautii]
MVGPGQHVRRRYPDSPWSAEGLTCYTTYRIVKELYGEDYAREHYVDQWRGEVEDYYLNFYVRHPEYLEALPEAERLAISNSLSGMRQYSEMPLKILKAEELVGARRPWMRSCTASSTGSWTPCTPI